jgi:hypothetical protein
MLPHGVVRRENPNPDSAHRSAELVCETDQSNPFVFGVRFEASDGTMTRVVSRGSP